MIDPNQKYVLEDCFELGQIIKPHGLKGEVSIFLDVDYPQDYSQLQQVLLLIGKELAPYSIELLRLLPNKPQTAIVKFENINSIETAETLSGTSLFLPLTSLPPMEGKNFYFHEIIDFQVTDLQHGELGNVKTVYTFSNNSLIAVDYQHKELLIPVNDEIITKVDRQLKQIHVNLPEGLLEL